MNNRSLLVALAVMVVGLVSFSFGVACGIHWEKTFVKSFSNLDLPVSSSKMDLPPDVRPGQRNTAWD